MGGHHPRKRGGGADGGAESGNQRHLVCMERPRDGSAGKQHHGILPNPGASPGDRIRAAGDGRRSCDAHPHDVSRSHQRLRTQAHGEMNTRRLIAACAAMVWLGTSASAHRLDEYLQATLLSVEKESVHGSMRLTPGVAVTPFVLAGVDANADGVISESERKAYAERLLRDVSLKIDGRELSPQLISVEFPGVEEMKQGLGEI